MSFADTVKCAVLQLEGHEPLYYGRAVFSGDWYISIEGDPETEQVLTWANDEGESIIIHPRGQRMVRLDWLLEGRREPRDHALLELMEHCRARRTAWLGACRSHRRLCLERRTAAVQWFPSTAQAARIMLAA